MTLRWRLLLASSAVVAVIAWLLSWPELMGLAGAGIVTSIAVAFWWGGSARGSMVVKAAPEFVPRLSNDVVPVAIDWARPPRRAWASCASANPADPRVWVPIDSDDVRLDWPIDSRTRGQRLVGPEDLTYADPFGLVARHIATATPASTTITPRVVAVPTVRRSRTSADDVEGVRVGHENFHTLREYVFGDEPRKIHWRSSARAQKLLVKVSVDAAEEQTVVVLDVDAAAYRQSAVLFHVVDQQLFEDAVDLAHSIALAASGPGRVSHLTTTLPGGRPVTVDAHHRNTGAVMLAYVEPVLGDYARAQDVSVLLKRAAVREVIVVTGRPQPELLAAMTGWRRLVQEVRLVSPVQDEIGEGATR